MRSSVGGGILPNIRLQAMAFVLAGFVAASVCRAGVGVPVRGEMGGAASGSGSSRLSGGQGAATKTASNSSDAGGVSGIPLNNNCAAATPITGTGDFAFDNISATQDGPAHSACSFFGEDQIANDIWYCWTAPAEACAGTYSVSTCNRTVVDTRIAVYEGCACPPADANLLTCHDDDCSVQTRATFTATPGQSYLIRLGNFPGELSGTGLFAISCDPPSPCTEPAGHCQTKDPADAINSTRTTFTVADGFTPLESGNINSVCWWGGYLSANCELTRPDSFRIRYFDDANGIPGNQIASFSQAGGTLTVDEPFATGGLINAQATEYEFHATHDAVPVTAGNCYWVEITNELTGCAWFWELGLSGDARALQDGSTAPMNGYDISDAIAADLALCLNLPIEQKGTNCLPPPPVNDDCADALAISGEGTFVTDTASATTDGPAHAACLSSAESGIDKDVWFDWTSTCTGTVVVRTCEDTPVDSKVAVYSGTSCPTILTTPVTCNDDLCGSAGLQSMVVFTANPNQHFLIRAGTFPQAPGGVISLAITCGAPDHVACIPGEISCCNANPLNEGGCGEEACCELVCACDPFCCDTEWDADCAADGFGNSGCGAQELCSCGVVCGNPESPDCCSEHPGVPGCNDATCCETICACDPYCCEVEWDQNCAGLGFDPLCEDTELPCESDLDCNPGVSCVGCGAAIHCSDLCSAGPACPQGAMTFTNPTHLAVDARQPHPPGNPAAPQGFTVFTVTGPAGATADCWGLAETAVAGAPNSIQSVVEGPAGTYTITLSRPITVGAGTSLTYTPTTGTVSRGCFRSHPGNVNADAAAAPADILEIIDHLNGVRVPPLAIWQCDIDRTNVCGPADILSEIDLLNGASGFQVWNGTQRPTGPAGCP